MVFIKPIDKNFGKYVIASMVTMFLQSAYSIVDGLFVSNLIDSTALAAINVSWPIIAVITAIGTGIGCGSAVIMSTKQGAGKNEESNHVAANAILALLLAGVLCTVVSLATLEPLLRLMGARDELLSYAIYYGRVMLGGSMLQILSCGLTPLLRNDNRAVTSMVIMVGGLCINLGLAYIFLGFFKWGIQGAAFASLCAQAFTVIACLIVLFGKKKNPLRFSQFRVQWAYWKRILQTAISPFGISLTPSLLILYHNVACMSTGNEFAIGAYALISSTVGSYRILLIGAAEGIQPLASYANGAKDYDGIRRIRNKSIVTALAISLVLFLFTIFTASYYPMLYGYTGEAANLSYYAVLLTAPQLIFTGLVRVTNSFFYAVGKTRYSLFMIYFDPLVMTPLAITILPKLFGMDGIWITAVVTQFILNLVAIVMFVKYEKELKILSKQQKAQAVLLKGT